MLPAMQSATVPLSQTKKVCFTFGPETFDPTYWDAFIRVIETLPSCHPTHGPWIAGGTVRRFLLGQDPWSADVDYFCRDAEQFNFLCAHLIERGASLITTTADHRTYLLDGRTIQVVQTRFRDRLMEHLEAFDFTLCQTGWDGERVHVTGRAYRDLEDRRLALVNASAVASPAGSWMRILKYAAQGFTAGEYTLETLLTLGAQSIGDVTVPYTVEETHG